MEINGPLLNGNLGQSSNLVVVCPDLYIATRRRVWSGHGKSTEASATGTNPCDLYAMSSHGVSKCKRMNKGNSGDNSGCWRGHNLRMEWRRDSYCCNRSK